MIDHDAPWRFDREFCNGDISPQIYDASCLKPLQQRKSSARFVLSTCDFDFLQKNFENLLAYQKSASEIYYAVGVYCVVGHEDKLQSTLAEINQKYSLTKILFFLFTCPKLNQILQQKTDKESAWDYKINFIRNARYNLLPQIWSILKIDHLELSLIDSSAYIVDFDNFFLGDINHIIKLKYGSQKMVFSWNSLQSPNKNFPSKLSGYSPTAGFNHAYKVVKAGFTAFSPNSFSRLFLRLYSFYTIGDSQSLIFMRLFTFYFSDQVGILLALLDLRYSFSDKYKEYIAWIDIATSDIINLSRNQAKYMWYPKGRTFTLKEQSIDSE